MVIGKNIIKLAMTTFDATPNPSQRMIKGAIAKVGIHWLITKIGSKSGCSDRIIAVMDLKI